MRNGNIKLYRDELHRYIFLKNELKLVLLKSIKKNQQIKPVLRGYSQYKIQKLNLFFTRQKNFCLITGKSGSVLKLTNTSRHMVNKLSQIGAFTNLKNNNFK